MSQDVRGVVGQGFDTAVTPTLGAGGGVSVAAPSILSEVLKERQLEMKKLAFTYENFYPVYRYPPVEWKYPGLEKELEAIRKIVELEGNDLWYFFLTAYINGHFEDLSDDIATLKRILQATLASKSSTSNREEIKTKSGKTIYIKVDNNKVLVYGDTFHVKDLLKSMKFKWDPVIKAWYAPINAININEVKTKLAEV